MNWFKNMKIRAKMLFSFMLVIALILAMVAVAATGMRGVGTSYDTVIRHPIALRATMFEFQSEYRNLRRIGATIAMHAGADDQGYESLYEEARISHELSLALFERARGIIGTNPELTPDERNLRLEKNETLFRLYTRYHDEVTVPIIEAARAHDRAAVPAILGSAAGLAEDVGATLRDAVDIAIATAAMQTARAEANTRSAVTLLVILSAIAAVLAVVVSFFVANQICRPLEPLTKFMRNVATRGDIDFTPEDAAVIQRYGRTGDELGQLIVASAGFVRRIMEIGKALEIVSEGDLTHPVSLLSDRDTMGLAFGKMLRNLNSMCGDINVSSIQVATGASQVTAGAEALSAGATEQAASIEQLSVSIAEMAERTKTTAGMAGQAADLANHIRSSAEKSNLQMNEMMKAVTGISEASQSIRKIIKTIDEIAFQTNILAVNAAVEAAHAGKYGKGFSVVASEVRSLAAKSAEAAKDTERLIANSMEKADLGVLIAGETATSLSEIVAGIKDNSQLVAEIARSAEEQSNSIAEINAGVTQVSRVVQQNSVTAEESAAASEEMAGQSVMLQRLASQFKLSEEPAYRLPVPASASEPEPARQLAGPRYAQLNNSDQ